MAVTVTLSRQDGNLLITFTAFFIGLVSARFWRIACFVLHRVYSTPEPKDVFHHQRQALLRNSATPDGGVWTLRRLWWAWRPSATRGRGFLRAFPSLLSAVVSLAAFTVASGFSSRTSTGISDEILIKSSNCGYPDAYGDASAKAFRQYDSYISGSVTAAANYAQECYKTESTSDVFDCSSGHFVVGRMPTTIDTEADCPFAPELCRSNNSKIRLDTGYLDSTDHFGINAPPDQRFLFRYVMHCAPLETEGYKHDTTVRDDFTGISVNYTRYNYGPVMNAAGGYDNNTGPFTYEVPNIVEQYDDPNDFPNRALGRTYQLM
jgi:hypothetical protein